MHATHLPREWLLILATRVWRRSVATNVVLRWLSLSVVLFFLSACKGADPSIEVVLSTDLPRNAVVRFTVRSIRLTRRAVDAGADVSAPRDVALSDATRDAPDATMDATRDAAVLDATVDVALVDARADAGGDGGSRPDVLMDGGSDAGTITLAIDPSVPSQEWRRNGTDAGITLPASFVLQQPMMGRDPVLIEVIADSDSLMDPPLPSLSWRQYAVITPSSNGPTVLRMLMSYRCASRVNGCGPNQTDNCAVYEFCRERGLTCGEDAQCVDPAGVPVFVARSESVVLPDGGCAPGRCGPWCPACPSGQSCNAAGMCVRTGSSPCADADGDGYGDGPYCLGRDCNDSSRVSFPGAGERCDRIDNDCNGQVDEGGVCGPFVNQTCATAVPINLMSSAEAVLYANTEQGVAMLPPMCRFAGRTGGDGKELWYSVTWPANDELELYAARSPIDRPDSVLLVFSDCTATAAALLGCNDDIALDGDFSSRVVLRPALGAPSTARTVFVAVDSYGTTSSGLIRLQARRHAASAQATCATPFDVGVGGTIVGSFTNTDAHRLTCAMANRLPDEVFRVTTTTSTVSVQASMPNRMSPLMYSRRQQCMPGPMDDCAMSDGGEIRLTIPSASSELVVLEGARNGAPYMINFSTTSNGI